jgi:hypothetical protein
MKTLISTLGLFALLVFALAPSLVCGQENNTGDGSVSFQTFYDQLSGQGQWIQTDDYGYVFQPNGNDANWRPYTYGHWVDTDAGMTWVSDEPFGWATYHYGRWVDLDGYGWVWVPGYTWAPAWVSWRSGDDEVGWAPLPPDSAVGIDYADDGSFDEDYGDDFDAGFHIGDDCDLAYGIGPAWYNFCPIIYIGDRDCWRHFRDRGDNFALIHHTRNVTNINFRRDSAGRFGRVTAEGPSVAALNARARTPIEHANLTSAPGLSGAGQHGSTLAVYAPRVDPDTMRTARPGSVSRTVAVTHVNRGTDINHPLAVNSQLRSAAPTAQQIHAAAQAQGNGSAGAKIATARTHISRPLTQPLRSLRTNARGDGVSARAGVSERGYTGERVTEGPTFSSSSESRFTGEAITHAPGMPSRSDSYSTVRSYGSGETYHPMYRPSMYYSSGASVFHSSVPAYHPASSFHSFAPAPHFGGGAPAAHFSGGSFGGGGHASLGGGGGHASVGGHR